MSLNLTLLSSVFLNHFMSFQSYWQKLKFTSVVDWIKYHFVQLYKIDIFT